MNIICIACYLILSSHSNALQIWCPVLCTVNSLCTKRNILL